MHCLLQLNPIFPLLRFSNLWEIFRDRRRETRFTELSRGWVLPRIYMQNSLVHLYGVCGESVNACKVFDQMPVRDVVSWTGIITDFTRTGLYKEALATFSNMDVEPNLATCICALVATGRVRCLRLGQGIHGLILKRASLISLETGNAFIDMYVKCEQLSAAMRVFGEMQKKDKISLKIVLISRLVQCKRSNEAIELFPK